MKKLLLVLALSGLLVSQLFAGQVQEEIISITNLTNSSSLATSGPIYVGDYKKLSFIIYNDETDAGAVVNNTFSMRGSYDGTTWLTQSFNDFASPITLVTSESLTTDTNYFCWLTPIMTMPILNVTITTDAETSGNYTNVTAYLIGEK